MAVATNGEPCQNRGVIEVFAMLVLAGPQAEASLLQRGRTALENFRVERAIEYLEAARQVNDTPRLQAYARRVGAWAAALETE